MLTRRSFVRASGMAVAALGAAPPWMLRAAAQGTGRRKVLVAIFQRGAADGLNMVVPFFEKRYYEMRPTIAVAPPDAPNGGIDLDGRFALHPSLQPLKEFWDGGQLALVHAAGSPDPTRSHFDAQEFMESGTPGRITDDGWLNRALPSASENSSPMRAVAMGTEVPRSLRGGRAAIALDNLARFRVGTPDLASTLEDLYTTSGDAALRAQGGGTFDAVRIIDRIRQQPYTPANGAQYIGQFGQRLQQVARLIKADAGVEVAFADIGGWDHHVNEAFPLTTLLREFATSLAAFVRDMGDRMEDIVIVTMSEFGRTAAENGSAGTDHGHGNVMMVLGSAVRGRGIYGTWPGLAPEQLYENRDLAVTTDFRDVLGELVRDHLGQKREAVFPGFNPGTTLGLLKHT